MIERPDLVEHLKATTGIGDDAEKVAAFMTDPEVAGRPPGDPLPVSVLRRHRDVLRLSNEDLTATIKARKEISDD